MGQNESHDNIFPRVLAVILNYKTFELTLDVVKKIHEVDYPNLDVLVVDNGSPNESAQILRNASELDGFIFIPNKHNGGYASGNNIGIRYAYEHGYKYSWILNNDVVFVDKIILKVLVDAAEADDNVACVGPRITDLNGNIVAPFIDRPNRWSQTIGIASARKKRESHKYESGKVYRVYGCCMLLKNKPLHEVEYMDERTFLFYEEDILAERLSKIGAYSYYCANTDIVHLESMTVNKEHGERSKEKTDIALRSMDLYLREYLHCDPISRKACEAVRKLILRLR